MVCKTKKTYFGKLKYVGSTDKHKNGHLTFLTQYTARKNTIEGLV